MRNLIALSLVFSFGLFADDHADEPEYKPSKAEYYVSVFKKGKDMDCLLYTSPSPRDVEESRMPSSA